MKIEVTQEDIDAGEPMECAACPVAIAIRKLTKLSMIEVGPNYILIEGKYFPTPKAVATFVDGFDDGETVQPFTFELPI